VGLTLSRKVVVRSQTSDMLRVWGNDAKREAMAKSGALQLAVWAPWLVYHLCLKHELFAVGNFFRCKGGARD